MNGKIQIFSTIQPKQRPRKGKFGFYTPKETSASELLIRNSFTQSFKFKPLENAIRLSIVVALPIPASTSKKNKTKMEEGFIYPAKRPDIDNYAKTICDALNGYLYKDDGQIVELKINKIYSVIPSTTISWEVLNVA